MTDTTSTAERWARFRFAVLGSLLAAPPEGGPLRAALTDLSRKSFTHPVTGQSTRFAFSTIERWFYAAARDADPVTQLRRRVRKDAGKRRRIGEDLAAAIRRQYAEHPRWSYLLHYDNLQALCEMDSSLGPLPSYATVRRYMKSQGWIRQRRRTDPRIASGPREVRSFEHPYAHALWHLDFQLLAQRASFGRPLGHAEAAGRARRPQRPVLPRPMVPRRVRGGAGARPLPGLHEAGPSALADDGNGSAMIAAETG